MPRVDADKATLYYESNGEGPAIVFAHGGGGNAASWWQQVPHFADRYRVITFDHRGFGRSTCEPEDVLAGYFADDMIRILDDTSIDQAVLIAQSMGGTTSILTALAHPDRVAGIVMGNASGPVLTPEVIEALSSIEERAKKAGGLSNLTLATDLAERDPALVFLYAQLSGFNPQRPLNVAALNAKIDLASLEALTMPMIMVTTDGDLLLPASAIRSVAPYLNAEVVEIAGSGHSPYFEKPDEYNTVIDEFLLKIGW